MKQNYYWRFFAILFLLSITVTAQTTEEGPIFTLPSDINEECDGVIDYPFPTATHDFETYTITQIGGLSSGEIFEQGITVNSFRFVEDKGETVTYDFESLIAGEPIHSQDNWVVSGNVNSNNATVQNFTSSGGYLGSKGLHIGSLGGNNHLYSSRVNDNNFALPIASDENIIEVIFDHNRNFWGNYLAFGLDANNDGQITENEITFGIFDRDNGNIVQVYGPGKTLLKSATKVVNGWTRWKITIDLAANNGKGSISVSYKDLSNNGTFITPEDLQDIVGDFDLSAVGPSNPKNINGILYRHEAGNSSMLGNITYAVKESVIKSFEVNIEDSTNPEVIVQNITVQLNENGTASITPGDIDNGSNDACGIEELSLNKTEFGCLDVLTDGSFNFTGNNHLKINGSAPFNFGTNTSFAFEAWVKPDSNGGELFSKRQLNRGDLAILSRINQNGGLLFGMDDYNRGGWTWLSTPSGTVTMNSWNHVALSYNSQNKMMQVFINGKLINETVNNKFSSTHNGEVRIGVSRDGNTHFHGSMKEVRIWSQALSEDLINDHLVNGIVPGNPNLIGDFNFNLLTRDGVTNESGFAIAAYSETNYYDSWLLSNSRVVTLTARDNNMNESSATARVIIQDAILPELNLADAEIPLDENGEATVTFDAFNQNSVDNCEIATWHISRSEFNADDLGEHQIIISAFDMAGNRATANVNLTVVDLINPEIECTEEIIQPTDPGKCNAMVEIAQPVHSDNVGVESIINDFNDTDDASDIYPVGTTIVTWTVTDTSGNTTSCSFDVTVEDNEAPEVLTQNITVELDENGVASITPEEIDNGSNDVCGIEQISLNITDFSCENVGENEVILTVIDSNGNEATASAIVTVEDNTPPTITCSEDIVVDSDPGYCQAMVTIPVPIISSNCPFTGSGTGTESDPFTTLERSSTVANGTYFFNVNGNAFSTLIEDGWILIASSAKTTSLPELPVTSNLSLQSNQILEPTVYADGSISSIRLNATGTSTTGVIPTLDITTNDSAVLANLMANRTLTTGVMGGINEWSGTDAGRANGSCSHSPRPLARSIFHACGNGSGIHWMPGDDLYSVSFNAYKNDLNLWVKAKPSVTNPGSSLVNDFNGTADASGIYPVGSTTVNWTITDDSGNTSTCQQTVTVLDNELPNAIARDITIQLDENGVASITSEDIDNGSTDACGIEQISLDITDFNCENVGENEVVLTVEDVNGNISQVTATVTVEDNEAPEVLTRNITVQLDENGVASITPDQIDNESFDACGIAELSLDITEFTCEDVGENEVVLIVEDVNGNISQATATVTVEDNVAPIAITQDLSIELDENGIASITAEDIDNGSNDACGITQISLDITEFSCENIGENEVVLTVEDHNGNISQATATVTIEDNVAPVAITQNISVHLDEDGLASITAQDIDNGSKDACGIAEMSLDITEFSCENVGENTVILTVFDNNGNETSAEAIVTVEDTTVPTVLTNDISIELDATGNAEIFPEMIDNGSYDNCEIATISLDQTEFNCDNVGENTVILSITDVNGNVATATAVVTVIDNIAPVIFTRDITVQLDANGGASITPAEIDNGSNDACGIAQMSLDITDFSCENVGENEVVLTVEDHNGNISQATATITVENNVPPVAITQNISVHLDENGLASITADDIDNGSNDACGIAEMSLDISEFNCEDVGENTVILTVIDNNGNETSASATVTVVDNFAPEVNIKSINLALDENGEVSITPEDIDNGSFDNCGIAEMSLDISDFTCEHIGDNTVTLTITDFNGNQATASTIVTVSDTTAPVVQTKDVELFLDAEGNAFLTPEMIDNDSWDNCGIASMDLDRAAFNCTDLGVNRVLLSITDTSGNTASAMANVNIINNQPPELLQPDLPEITSECAIDLIDLEVPEAVGICQAVIVANTQAPQRISESMTITWYFEDESGNQITQTQEINIEDITAPVPNQLSLQDIIVDCGIENIPPPTATDNCDGQIIATTQDPTSYNEQGDYIITWTFTDAAGNSSTQDQFVVVEDTTPPVAVATDLTINMDFNDIIIIRPEDIDAGSYDQCGEVNLSLDRTGFDEEGIYEVILTVTDENGNSASTTATVTINLRPFETNSVHVVPTMLTRNSIARVIVSEGGSITEVQIIETETGKYKLFEGNDKQQMEIDVAPLKGTLLVRVIDQNGKVHLKKLIAL